MTRKTATFFLVWVCCTMYHLVEVDISERSQTCPYINYSRREYRKFKRFLHCGSCQNESTPPPQAARHDSTPPPQPSSAWDTTYLHWTGSAPAKLFDGTARNPSNASWNAFIRISRKRSKDTKTIHSSFGTNTALTDCNSREAYGTTKNPDENWRKVHPMMATNQSKNWQISIDS